MRTQRTKSQRARNIGAAICALLLCFGMVGLLASMGTSSAHADGGARDGAATPSATKEEIVGYYATVTADTPATDPDTGSSHTLHPGSSGRNSSGGWVNLALYNVRISGGAARIDEADLPALQSVMSFPKSPGASADGITWWPLYVVKEVPDPPSGTGTTNKKPEVVPEPDRTSAETTPETPSDAQTPSPQTPSAPVTKPQETPKAGQAPVHTEPELLSLQCRESEAEAKIAELEAQGYEIVRIEKLPKWYR